MKDTLKLALEALETAWYHVGTFCPTDEAIELYDEARAAIKEALAQPEQEPVAWVVYSSAENDIVWADKGKRLKQNTPLYITPPQRTWVGLTPQERDEINEQVYGAAPHHVAFHAAIEAKLKEKNT